MKKRVILIFAAYVALGVIAWAALGLGGEREATYTVRVTDGEGNPVQGALVQFCTETLCQAVPSDEEGVSRLVAEPYAYEVHIAAVPDGYAGVEGAVVMPSGGGNLTVALERN